LRDFKNNELLPTEYDKIWLDKEFGTNIFGTRKDGIRKYYDLKSNEF